MKKTCLAIILALTIPQSALANTEHQILQANDIIEFSDVRFEFREDSYKDVIAWDYEISNISEYPIRRIKMEAWAFNERPVPVAKLDSYGEYEIAGGLLPNETMIVRGEIRIEGRFEELNVQTEDLRAELEVEDIMDADHYSLLCKKSRWHASSADIRENPEGYSLAEGPSPLLCPQ